MFDPINDDLTPEWQREILDLDNDENPQATVQDLPVGQIVMLQGKLAKVVDLPERSDLAEHSPLQQALYREDRATGPKPKTIEFIEGGE